MRPQRAVSNTTSSSSSDRRDCDRISSNSPFQAFVRSPRYYQRDMDESCARPCSGSRRGCGNARSKSPHRGSTGYGDEVCNRSSSRLRQGRSRSRSGSGSEQRKHRRNSRPLEAPSSYRCRDTSQVYISKYLQRDVHVGAGRQSALGKGYEAHATRKAGVVQEQGHDCDRMSWRYDQSEGARPQRHCSRPHTSSVAHELHDRGDFLYTMARRDRARDLSQHEYCNLRNLASECGKNAYASHTSDFRIRRSSSGDAAPRGHGEEETGQFLSRARDEKEASGSRSCLHSRVKDASTARHPHVRPQDSTPRFDSLVAPGRAQRDSAKDAPSSRTWDSGRGSRQPEERGRSRVGGGEQRRDAFMRDGRQGNLRDEETSQHGGESPAAVAVEASKNEKGERGDTSEWTAELPSLCHTSAQEALKQRIRQRLREGEQRRGVCSAAESKSLSSKADVVLTAREGRLLSWKQLITAESQEAYKSNDTRGSWNAVVDRQGKEQLDEEVQKLVDDEDETRFTAFLERKRRERLREEEMRRDGSTFDGQSATGDADSQRKNLKAAAALLESRDRAADSHLDAIFGRTRLESLSCNTPEVTASETTPAWSKAHVVPGDVVTTTLPGLEGVALLADAITMEPGIASAGWKLRRQLQRQQKM